MESDAGLNQRLTHPQTIVICEAIRLNSSGCPGVCKSVLLPSACPRDVAVQGGLGLGCGAVQAELFHDFEGGAQFRDAHEDGLMILA